MTASKQVNRKHCIELPPLKNDEGEKAFIGMVRFETDILTIDITDEAAGAFVEMLQVDPATPIRMDANELLGLAKWAVESCNTLDEYHRKGDTHGGGNERQNYP